MSRPGNMVFSQFNGLARTLYHRAPPGLHWVLSPLAFCFRVLRQLRLDFWIVQGEELSSRTSLSILCATNDRNRSYIAGLAFGANYCEQYLGRAWLWNANIMTEKTGRGYSMMLVEIHTSLRRLLGTSNWFYVPDWVRGTIDFPLKPTITNCESVKSDLRRIRKNDLGFEVTRETQRFDDFYHNMYVPYTVRAHGSSAKITPYELMRNQFKNGELLLVTKQQKHIAGILIRYSKAGPCLSSLGIWHGNWKYVRYGAAGALYYFSLRYLEDKGFSKVDCGLSRAFLRDGVLRYKKKWGQRIVGMSSNMFALKVLSYTAATRAFLVNNPFIFEYRGSSNGAVFVDTEKLLLPQELERIDKDYFYPGLSKLFVYLLQRNHTPKPNVVPPELSARIVLRSAEDRDKGAGNHHAEQRENRSFTETTGPECRDVCRR